jgi:hypothetical protein
MDKKLVKNEICEESKQMWIQNKQILELLWFGHLW